MRIDPSNAFSGVNPNSLSGTKSAPSPSKQADKATQSGSKLEGSEFTPTSDLSKLLQAVRELPDVRQDVIDDVTQRLTQGELSTRTAAEETAEAFLDSPE